jgi:hypothetical protein
MLTHNDSDTKWFRAAAKVASAVYFTKKRVKFESPTGEKASPTRGQTFMYFGDNPAAFERVFSTEGGLMFPPPLAQRAAVDPEALADVIKQVPRVRAVNDAAERFEAEKAAG